MHARAVIAGDTVDELERIAGWCRATARGAVRRAPVRRAAGRGGSARAARHAHPTELDPAQCRGRRPAEPATRRDRCDRRRRAVVACAARCPRARFARVARPARPSSRTSAPGCARRTGRFRTPSARALDLWLRDRAGLEIDPRAVGARCERRARGAPSGRAVDLTAHVQAAARSWEAAMHRRASGRSDFATRSRRWGGRAHARWTATRSRRARASPSCSTTSASSSPPRRPSLATMPSRGCASWRAARRFGRRAAIALVTISPQLADPIVRYDGIWVAGLHADAWPQPVQPDPFLPLAAQLAAGVPSASAAGRAAEARALMAAWRAATDELVLSAPLACGRRAAFAEPAARGFAATPDEPARARRGSRCASAVRR